ncbi:MAG: YbbR-like domain-containing protein [Vulcanibacillus sp.]
MDNWLKNNNVLKALSLIFGIMLWLVVTMGANNTFIESSVKTNISEYFFETEVLAIYDKDQYVVEMLTDKVNITLTGDIALIDKLRGGVNIDDGEIFVNLESYTPGTYEVPIEYSGFPLGVEVKIEPSNAHLNLEVKHTKEIDIVVEKLGIEKDGFQTGEPIINPKKAFISGTKKQIDQIVSVKAYVNIDNINNFVSQQIPLRAVDSNGNVVDVDIMPESTYIQIPVSSPFLTVPLTYKIVNYPPEGYAVESLNLITKDVTIYGDKDIIDKYELYPGLELDLSSYIEKQRVTIDLFKDESLIKMEPNSIEIEANIVKSTIRDINVPIDIIGLEEGTIAEIVAPTNQIDIKLEGAPTVLFSISTFDIQAFVDISNLQPGEHKVLIQYNTPVLAKNLSEERFADVIITQE